MPRGLGIRFALEAAFLVAVAVVAVVADLRWPLIVLAMALAWGVVSLVEWWASRRQAPPRPVVRPEPQVRRREPAPAPPASELELPQHVRVLTPAAATPPPEPVAQPEAEPEPEPEPVVEPVRPPLVAVPTPPPPEPEALPEPEPFAEPEPLPEPQIVQLAVRDHRPREWNLWELERAARGTAGRDPLQDEERGYLLMYLREFANADGALPVDFDGLVRDAFGDVLAAVGAP